MSFAEQEKAKVFEMFIFTKLSYSTQKNERNNVCRQKSLLLARS